MIWYEKRATCVAFAALVAQGCVDSNLPTGANPVRPDAPEAGPASETLQQIVYYGTTGNDGGLNLIRSDGSGAMQLASSGWSPAWSPDGSNLVFSNTQCDTDWYTYLRCDRGGLVTINLETRRVTTLAAGAFGEDPAWAPTGDLIAFVRHDESKGRRLFVTRLDGSIPQEIHTPGLWDAFGPSWSPDGQRIVFQCHGSSIGICVVNSDGTGFSKLSSSRSGESDVSPSWSPDGSRIAFAIFFGGAGKIALMAPDGSGVIVLTDGLGPAWSRDGKKLAFSRNNDGLFTINANGSNLKRLTSGNHSSPAWRP